jgi:dihydrolipoamide dehydrogenase
MAPASGTDFDLIVIGAGPGGYVAAIRAAQLGMRTAIVERENLGGVCLNWGCIPTKALLKSGEVMDTVQHLADYGLTAEKLSFDFGKIVARSRAAAAQLSKGVAFLMRKNKIEVLDGTARLEAGEGAPAVVVTLRAGGERRLTAKSVILATGARARALPQLGLEPDGERVWTYREAMVPKAAPKSLLVVGSGAIGIEFASFYRALGTEVTVIEAVDRILPVEDEEVSTAARKAFEKRGVKFRTGAKVTRLTKPDAGVALELEAGGKAETLTADVCIVAVGIVANTDGIGLEALGVTLERGQVVTDAHGATSVPGLYAIGDVAGAPWLATRPATRACTPSSTSRASSPPA